MRIRFIILLLGTLLVSGWYYYQIAPPCVIPKKYTIGVIDPRFKLKQVEAEKIVTDATVVWEEAVGRDLFVYDSTASFKVDFIYDERQSKSDTAEIQKEVLTEKEAESKKIGEEYTALVAEYDNVKKAYDSETAKYQKILHTFNVTVKKFNDVGGAPADEYTKLQKTETNLKADEQKLKTTANTLTTIAKKINTLSEAGNAAIAEYNNRVRNFNETFTGGEQFTQGDYTGTGIHVYNFKDTNELRNVLIHEFGHAIGLAHVEGRASIMYYLMDQQPTTSELSKEDRVALALTCQSNTTLTQRFHNILSSFFIKLNII